MKLKHIAITAFALSMSAAFAASEAANPQDNLKDKNKPATAAENAPAGYGDKSTAAEPMMGQKDTQKAQKKHKKAAKAESGIVTSETAAKSDTPAGYSDKSTTADNKAKAKDTQAGQVQPDAGLGASAAAPAQPGAPAGYADKSAPAQPEAQDTQKAQSK